ncbi:MAG: HD domain-containing protein [Gammaproteobacteria bacterium]|nr:HD domain-containing protein [Gammaproteobacteria bacterium]
MKKYKNNPGLIGVLLLVIFSVVSVWLVSVYVEKERSRDMLAWQGRLGIIADHKTRNVELYISEKNKQLKSLADNNTLKLYLSQYKNIADEEVLRAQYFHLRNLLVASAGYFGFDLDSGQGPIANDMKYYPGIGVVDNDGKLMLATGGYPENTSVYAENIKNSLISGKSSFIDVFKYDDGRVYFGMVMPVLHIQKNNVVGAVVMLLKPSEGLYGLLVNERLETDTDETLLVKSSENSLIFISPVSDEFELFHQVAINSDFAEVGAYKRPGSFFMGVDYRNVPVLITARKVAGTSWVLIQEINADEALEESNRHQQFLLTTFILIVLFLVVLLIAVWRHSTSLRLKKITNDLESRTELLNAVSDNTKEYIFLEDQSSNIQFCNYRLASALNLSPEDCVDKKTSSIIGYDVVAQLEKLSDEKHDDGQSVVKLNLAGKERSYHVSIIRLASGEFKQSVLYVLHDITGLRKAQEKRDRLSKGIISTLVKIVDLHDPFCVEHSERTREVAQAIAHALDLSDKSRESLEMASLLANIGKLFVPKEILTKLEPLTEDENNILRQNVYFVTEILKELEFEGPVIDIITQKNEYLDGTGYPHGLKGDDIMLESRVLSVANAFVAMTSSRAYREGKAVSDVLDILLKQKDSRYDRHVIAALFHIAENKKNWNSWKDVGKRD